MSEPLIPIPDQILQDPASQGFLLQLRGFLAGKERQGAWRLILVPIEAPGAHDPTLTAMDAQPKPESI